MSKKNRKQLRYRRLLVRGSDVISEDGFKLARERLRWNYTKAADFLWVSEKTIRNWESGRARIPYAAYRLLRLRAGHELTVCGWESWSIGHKGELVSPAGRCFEHKDLEFLSLIFAQARLWREGQKTRRPQRSEDARRGAPPTVTRGEK